MCGRQALTLRKFKQEAVLLGGLLAQCRELLHGFGRVYCCQNLGSADLSEME